MGIKQSTWTRALVTFDFVPLSACQFSASPRGAVEDYLEALRDGKLQVAKEYQCHKGEDGIVCANELGNIQGWSVIDEERAVNERDPDSQYTVVLVRLESMSQ